MGRRGGRPRKPGVVRFPSGDPKPEPEGIAPAAWQRMRTEALKKVIDPRMGVELSRLANAGKLTAVQTAAGFRVAEIYQKFERYKHKRRSPASPNYQPGFGGEAGIDAELMDADELEAHEDRIREAVSDFKWLTGDKAADRKKPLLGIMPDGPMRAAIEDLCVNDRAVPWWMLADVRRALDRLALHFGDKWRNKRAAAAPLAAVAAKPAIFSAKPSSILHSFETVLSVLRPDMTPDERHRAADVAAAIHARREFERDKTNKRSLTKTRGIR